MDFPNNVSTNVYKIDDVRRIYWAFYSRRHGEDEKEKKVLGEQPKGEIRDAGYPARAIEYSFRERGYHVLLDEDKPGLWVFCLSEEEMTGIAQLQDLNEFESLHSGTVHSVDLSSALSPHLSPADRGTASSRPTNGIGEINTQVFNANTKMDPWPSVAGLVDSKKSLASVGHGYTMTDIYPRILAAVSYTLSYLLSRAKDLLLIGSCTYVDVRTLGDHAYEHLEMSPATAGTAVVSCSVRWLSSGYLLFALSEATLPRLSTIPHVLLSSPGSSAVSLGDPLLLSPSGIVGQYHGIENTSRSHPLYRTRAEMKSSISSGLTLRGISLPAKIQWALVLLDAHKDERESTGQDPPKSSRMTLWPAHLCLSLDVQVIARDAKTTVAPGPTPGSANDPLERAQEWFLGKAARIEALDARLRKDQAEAQRSKKAADVEEEDTVSDFESQIDRDVSPRDVSGIYPTPPDGLPSTARNSSVSNEPHASGYDEEANEGIAYDGMHHPYEEQRNDDLFEEMDIDLFATNGLTEDDFSFFDEPSLRGEDEHDNAAVTSPSEPFTFEEPVIAPASILALEDNPSPISEEALDDAPPNLPADTVNIIESSEGCSIEPLNTHNPAPDNTHLDTNHEDAHETPSIKEEAANHSILGLESLLPESRQPQTVSFDLVPFHSTSFDFDSKYASQGRYAFRLHDLPKVSKPGDTASHGNHVPYLGVLEMGRSSAEDNMDIDKSDDEASATSPNGNRHYDEDGDIDDDESNAGGPPEASDQQSVRKRKRGSSETSDYPAAPLSSTPPAKDQAEMMEQHTTLVPPNDLYSPRNTRHDNDNMDTHFRCNHLDIAVLVGKERIFIQVAQMVAHQAVSGINSLQASTDCFPKKDTLAMTGLRQQFEEVLAFVSSKWGKVSKLCTLKDFADMDDHNSINATRNQDHPQPRPPRTLYTTRTNPTMGQAVFKFQAPYTCVQRTGTPIDIAASALRFWEELSLAPSHGQKNVIAFCVFADESVQDQVLTFLNMMKGAYQSCNLGLHEVGNGESSSGLFPTPIDGSRLGDPSPAFYLACERVGKLLAHMNIRDGNTVIYMVNPSINGQHLPTLCTGFLKLFDAYLATAKQKNVEKLNDLVLQIVPSELIYSANALPMPSPSDYRRLALEVYDRCGPNDIGQHRNTSQYVCAPSIRLSRAVPKTIDFKLTSDNSALSLQSDNCLHIAYAWNPGEDWLTASWTDNLGVLSWNACYCLGGNDENPWPIISEIANEIWETTLDMLQPRGGNWHLFISKVGAFLKKELNIWQSAFGDGNNSLVKSSIRASFFTIDLDPLLDFPIRDLEIQGSETAMKSLATPNDTPQANAPSPEISGLGSTPGGAAQASTPPPSTAFGDHHGEARLIDIADETWGVVIKANVDDVCNAPDDCPALAGGYLVKRAGPRDEDGLVRMGVNVIYGQTPHRPLLKAVLGWYRNLGLLARVRGLADPVKSVVPYHVAATNKAHAAVTATMRYGDGNG